MTVIQNTQNYYEDKDRNRPDRMVYDLNEEKKMIAQATEEIKKELWEKWQKRYAGAQIFPSKLDNVNPNLVDFLLSFGNTLFCNSLAKKFNFNQSQRDTLPQVIWEISLSKNWGAINTLLGTKLSLNPEISNQIVQQINQNILFKAKELAESKFVPSSRMVAGDKKESIILELSLLQAIQTYPQLGEQIITSSPIKIRIFPTPVRPSIKNWIEDYQSVMGAGRHGMMERGNYLFHSENTKKLTAGDRKKLAEVLRSLDEDVTLKIDPENQEIFFEETSESPKIPASIISDESVQPVQPIQQPVQKVEKPPIQQSPIVNLSSKSGPRPVLPVQAIPFQKPVQMQNYPAKPVFSQKGESRISSGDVSRPTIQKPEYNPRADFQKQNVNNFFKSEQIKPEQPKPAFQEKKQNDYFSRYTSNAGKSWEEVSKEDDSFSNNNPKIVGNIVDLKG